MFEQMEIRTRTILNSVMSFFFKANYKTPAKKLVKSYFDSYHMIVVYPRNTASESTQEVPQSQTTDKLHSGKSTTIRESNHGLGACKEHYTQ